MGGDDYVIDGDLAFSNKSSALKFYQDEYHKKKEWVGLTDEERIDCEIRAEHNWVLFADIIEAKLKDKNETT